MATSEPAYLPVGTDVSAKYRGAFCEAKVKKIVKSVKCKVFVKETQSSMLITDEYITGPLKVGATVEVRHPETGRVMEAIIKHLTDSSMYTVVFDDADERTLRRTGLCLKGDKHFMESETLDNLPLSNPEHFGTPVIKNKRGRTSHGTPTSTVEESEESSDEEGGSPRRRVYKGKGQDLVSKVMFYENGDRKRSQFLPMLVVLPDAHTTELKNKDHLLVRSFKDGKFLSMARKDLQVFNRDIVLKNEDKSLKPAYEKALLFIDNRELPPSWNKAEMLGSDDEDMEEDEGSEDDAPSEEKDRFVAQLYKFCDDRGTPMNKGPSIGSKDLNLQKLFKVVQNLGGYNRVTNQMKWRLVYSKMALPPSNTASTQIKNAYKKYLHAFEDFYRKLGSSMGTISRPGRNNRNEPGRSILNFRAKGSDTRNDSDKDKMSDKMSEGTRSEIDSDMESTPKQGGTPTKRTKSARVKLEMVKDEKKDDVKVEQKKDEKKETKKGEDTPKKTVAKKNEEKKDLKPEGEKKGMKKKEEASPVIKKETEEEKELKELQKKISRRRSFRSEDKPEETTAEETDSKKEKKDKTEKKKDDNESEDIKKEPVEEKTEKTEKTEKRIKKKTFKMAELKGEEYKPEISTPKDKDKEDQDSCPPSLAVSFTDIPEGSKLKVRYGKGKNTRNYEAKIMEVGTNPGARQYLVHYQGWNTRHDEWIKQERIVKVLDRPDKKKKEKQQSPKPQSANKPMKKKNMFDKPPGSPSSVTSEVSTTSTPTQAPVSEHQPSVKPDISSTPSAGPGRPTKVKATPTVTQTTPTPSTPVTTPAVVGKPRPTRSNSVEVNVVEGLPAKRRSRKGMFETLNDSDTDESDKSENEKEEENKTEEKEKVESNVSPSKSISMPSISSQSKEDISEIDTSIDRSPPQLSKVTDINKDKIEVEEKVVTSVEKVSEVKEEPVAPVLKVMDLEKNSEPILQKLEAQLTAASPVKVNLVEVKVKDIVEKKVKDIVEKKEPAKRGRKPLVRVDIEETVKKVDKLKEEKARDEVVSETVIEKDVNKDKIASLFEFKDDSESEMEVKVREKRKPIVVMQALKVEEKIAKVVNQAKTVNESPIINDQNKSHEEPTKSFALASSTLFDEKDSAKSDSEVEKRGRKKKLIQTPKEDVKVVKKMKMTVAEKKLIQMPHALLEKKLVTTSASPERKPFITLAEKKQGFSPMVRKLTVVPIEKNEQLDAVMNSVIAVTEPERESAIPNEEVKKPSEMVVVHKESPVKNDIVLGKKVEVNEQDSEENGNKQKDEDLDFNKDDLDESVNEGLSVKKKVRKKTKKKIEMDELENSGLISTPPIINKKVTKTRGLGAKTKESVKKTKDLSPNQKDQEGLSAISDAIDIDLRCEEEIRSRSASPETITKPLHHMSDMDSGAFGPLLEAMECTLQKENQQRSSGMASKSQIIINKNNMYENTPPTTPERDSDEANHDNNSSQNDQIKNTGKDTHPAIGSESPEGNASPSNRSTGSSSGMVGGSEGSVDVPVHTTKRRRESDEGTPSKRRKRASRGKAAANRAKNIAESDSEEASNVSVKYGSPYYTSDSYPHKSPHHDRSPRPSKYNFNIEEGKYLEGGPRIAFLVDKIQDIRKIYMELKSEVACIDRRRKRMRRREKESANSSAVEVDFS